MHRRFVAASAIAATVTAALLTGAGAPSSAAVVRGAQRVPAGLAAAIHARLGAGAIRPSVGTSLRIDPLLGYTVALSADGTTALVGAPTADGIRGEAYIFHASDAGSWSSTGTPTATLTTKKGHVGEFGIAVALSAEGTTAFVGAPYTGVGPSFAGAIYAFHVSAEDAWHSFSAPSATLTVSKHTFLGFGLAVSPDGTTLVAAAPDSYGPYGRGAAYVFHASSESAWASTATPTATLSNAGEGNDDLRQGFGVAISGDGTTALVSDAGNPSGGRAYVFHVAGEDAWASSTTPNAILSDSNSAGASGLGATVALSADGKLALLGAPFLGDSETGLVDVFHSSAEDAWASTSTPTATLTTGGGLSDLLGFTVSLSADGTTALLTAPRAHSGRGAAYVFRASDEGAWASSSTPTATLTDSAGHQGDYLGIGGALSTDGKTVIAGAPGVEKRTGAVDVFHVADVSSWATSSTPNASVTDKALAACVVPKLKGSKLFPAEVALAIGRCRLGKVTKVHAAKAKKGRVLSQSKKAGKRLAIGAKVNVKIGK
ncbi:MAG TPA: hypothetical protein VGH79_04210 [Gaiellaceae bacterium]|jgi:hypothetical protein